LKLFMDTLGNPDFGEHAGEKGEPEAAREDRLAKLFVESHANVEQWCALAGAERWGISRARFMAELKRCAGAKFRGAGPSAAELEGYLGTLHLEDLALACACADGVAAAWEYFFAVYRGYLRGCAGAMLKRSAASPEAEELADSLYAELYGLSAKKRGLLLRYFHGRSSLKTWLRAVLAQRHVDAIRAGRKFEELEVVDGADRADGASRRVLSATELAAGLGSAGAADPHRERYLRLFSGALEMALKNVDAQDWVRLRMYYVEEKKLAEIGRTLGEHESSVSRHLEKVRRELRVAVERILRGGTGGVATGRAGAGAVNGDAGRGLSDAEIALCFEYAAEGAPIDLDKLFSQGEMGTDRNTQDM
jgi:RNA polymerase sigma factor (sigma-70 family)